MPVHAREKKENNHEEMDVDYPENEGSSSEDEDTESSSVSEDGDSSGGERAAISTTVQLTGPGPARPGPDDHHPKQRSWI